MTEIGTEAFEAIYGQLPECHAQIRVNTEVITKALCSGINFIRESTEQGNVDGTSVTVRTLTSLENPRNALTIGKVMEVNHVGIDEWTRLRIAGRKETAGVIVLTMETPYE